MIIPEGRLLSGQIQRSISIHDATDEDSHSLHLPPLASPLAIQKGRSRASAHTPLGQSEFHESLGLIAQKKLVSELDKKILILSSFLFRLECYASPKLKECLSLFQSLSSCLDLMGDPMAKIGPIQRQIAEISYEVEEESRQCVDRYAVACLSTIAPTISKHVDKVPSFAAEMTFERRIAELVSNLVTTGLTNKMTVTGSSENECMIKCRYRNGRVQILTREIIGQGGMKTIWKVSILAGPTGRFGSLFAYAKPRADGEKFTRDQCLIFMSRELEIENFLRKSGVCNIVELVPEFRQKSVKRKMKGFVMEFFDIGDVSAVIRHSRWPLPKEVAAGRLKLAWSMALALAGCHAHGTLHGDFKAENLFLKTVEGGARVRLGDLGCSIPVGTVSSCFIGSLPFLAPEQWVGVHEGGWLATTGTDMWPFGLFLFDLIYGEKQNLICCSINESFVSSPPSKQLALITQAHKALMDRLSPADPLNRIIAELLNLDPQRRLSAAQTAERLELLIIETQ